MNYIRKILLLPLFVQICIGTVFGIEQRVISDKSQCNSCDKNQTVNEKADEELFSQEDKNTLNQNIQQIVVIPFSIDYENHQNQLTNTLIKKIFQNLIHKKLSLYYVEFNSLEEKEKTKNKQFSFYQSIYLSFFSFLKFNYSQFYSHLILTPELS